MSLGDVAGYYCQLNECIEELRRRDIKNIMGNHDFYVASGVDCPRSNSANICLEHQKKTLKPENLQWLQGSVKSLELGHTDGEIISMVHGGWRDPMDEYLYRISPEYFHDLQGKYFFAGHTHVQFTADFTDKKFCNPGSVGQPRDGDARAAYAVLTDDGQVELHRTEYDIEQICSAMSNFGFDAYLFENLKKGTRIGGVIDKIQVAD